MRHLILAAALLLPAASPVAAPSASMLERTKFAGDRIGCLSSRVRHADVAGTARYNRLGDLPPGDLQLAVVREVDGCQEPVIVRQGYGALSAPERARR